MMQVIIKIDERNCFYLYDNEILDLIRTAVCAAQGLSEERVSVEINVPPKKQG